MGDHPLSPEDSVIVADDGKAAKYRINPKRKSSIDIIFERSRADSKIFRLPDLFWASIEEDSTSRTRRASKDSSLEFLTVPALTTDDVNTALRALSTHKKRWKKLAQNKDFTITGIKTKPVLRYSLQSYVEIRKVSECTQSYSGSLQPNENNESYFTSSCDPWNYVCEPKSCFLDEEVVVDLHESSYIAQCSLCSGQGTGYCFHCRGSGNGRCGTCNGTGMRSGVPHPSVITHPMVGTSSGNSSISSHHLIPGHPSTSLSPKREPRIGGAYAKGTPMHFASVAGLPPPGVSPVDLCVLCQGSGLRQCHYCKGSAKKLCDKCAGSGKVRAFMKLRIKFETMSSEYLHSCPVPADATVEISGDIIFVENKSQLSCVDSFPLKAICDQSVRMLHAHKCQTDGYYRILQQRHMIESIPMSQVTYTTKGGEEGVFWILGVERYAYVPDVKQRCVVL